MSLAAKHRVLITGGTGLLSLNWACAIRDHWTVILGTHNHSVILKGAIPHKLNLDNFQHLLCQIKHLSPDLVVHTAGLTNVDECERNPQHARRVNVELSHNVALASAQLDLPLVHISTDHLFSGNRSFYCESDPPEPLNEYARSKLDAEELVRKAYPKAIVVRTNFFGWGHAQRQSFSDWIIYNLRAKKRLSLFEDVYFTPILADELAWTVHKLVEKGVSGVFNLVGDERVSKYQFALQLAKHFDLPTELIVRSCSKKAIFLAERPQDMSLDNSKVYQVLNQNLGSLDVFLAALRRQELQGRSLELLNSVSQSVI